jgi:DNA-directed RNA polymerase specialized sigma24 family protein
VPVPEPLRVADLPAANGASAGLVDPRIMTALMRLPARQRQVVALRLILDLDTARTARVLGIAPGTVMARLGRAMAALRRDLDPELQQENRS